MVWGEGAKGRGGMEDRVKGFGWGQRILRGWMLRSSGKGVGARNRIKA